jgi:hypothetical protein
MESIVFGRPLWGQNLFINQCYDDIWMVPQVDHIPAALRRADRRVFWQRGQEVLARFGVACRPLDEQPLLGTQACLADIAASVAYPHGREAVLQRCIGPSRHVTRCRR